SGRCGPLGHRPQPSGGRGERRNGSAAHEATARGLIGQRTAATGRTATAVRASPAEACTSHCAAETEESRCQPSGDGLLRQTLSQLRTHCRSSTRNHDTSIKRTTIMATANTLPSLNDASERDPFNNNSYGTLVDAP